MLLQDLSVHLSVHFLIVLDEVDVSSVFLDIIKSGGGGHILHLDLFLFFNYGHVGGVNSVCLCEEIVKPWPQTLDPGTP